MKTIAVRVSDWMWERLQAEAKAQGRSLSAHVLYRAGALEHFKQEPPATPRNKMSQSATSTTQEKPDTGLQVTVSPPFDPTARHERFIAAHEAGETTRVDVCTCGPGEKAKGKHNKYCPMRGK
jgi:hypothetical protein